MHCTCTLEPPGLQEFPFYSGFGKYDTECQSSDCEQQLRLVERIAQNVKGA
jgi:hypothetical protein